jgi:UDP-N-acetylmuramoyl-tripeptide--D-alanyl-D-alanine ligase
MEKDADVYSDNISINESGMSFKLHHNMASIEIAMSQKGRFFIKNALCAATIAIGFGLSLENIKKGLESFEMPKMRMETFFSKSGALFINDAYNANPSSMREAIRTICETYPQKEITLVLGDMLELGDKTDLYHKEMGSFIDKFNIKSVYLTGSKMSNAKDELKNKSVYYFNNSTALAKELKKAKLNSNSVVLLKASRGMKLEKVLEKQI